MHVDEIKNLKNSTNQLNELQHQFLKIDESVKLHATEISTLAKLSNLKNEQIVYIKAHQDTLKAELWLELNEFRKQLGRLDEQKKKMLDCICSSKKLIDSEASNQNYSPCSYGHYQPRLAVKDLTKGTNKAGYNY